MTSLRSNPTFVFLFALICSLSQASISQAKPRLSQPAPESGPFGGAGVIQLQTQAVQSPTFSQSSLVLEYGLVDPITPISERVVQPLTSDQSIAVLLKKDARLLSLQKILIQNSSGSTLLELSRNELNPLRNRAITGATLLLDLNESGTGLIPRALLSPVEFWEVPAREKSPGLAFVEKDLFDLLRLDDLDDSLLRIRSVSAASESFYQEIVGLVQKAPAIDVSRLLLLLDSAYYSERTIAAMKQRLRELPDNAENAVTRATLSKNIDLGEKLSPLIDRTALVGLVKLNQMNFAESLSILRRIFAGSANIETCFKIAFDKLGGAYEGLIPNQKLELFSLAAQKRALEFAGPLGKDWFLVNSDKSFGALLELLRQLPTSSVRDELTRVAQQATGTLSVAEFAALTTAVESNTVVLELYQTIGLRITSLTANQVLVLMSQRPAGEFRDQLLLLVVTNLIELDSGALQNLLLACSSWNCRRSLLKGAYSKIQGKKGLAIGEVLLVLPEESARDQLILDTVELSPLVSPSEVISLFQASLSEETAKILFDQAFQKLAPWYVAEALALSDGMYKPGFNIDLFRDRLLLKAVESTMDLSSSNLNEFLLRASSDATREELSRVGRGRLGI